MASVITLEGIDQAISSLNYKNKATIKCRFVHAIRQFYTNKDSIESIETINTDELVRLLWDTGGRAEAIRNRRKNLNSIKSSVNADLKKRFKEGKNPEGIIIGHANIFEMSEDAKDQVLKEFGFDLKPDGTVSLSQIMDILKAANKTLSNAQAIEDMESSEGIEKIDQLKDLIQGLSEKVSSIAKGVSEENAYKMEGMETEDALREAGRRSGKGDESEGSEGGEVSKMAGRHKGERESSGSGISGKGDGGGFEETGDVESREGPGFKEGLGWGDRERGDGSGPQETGDVSAASEGVGEALLDDLEDMDEEDVIEDVDDIEEEELVDDVEEVDDEEMLEELEDVEGMDEEDVIEDVNDVEEEEVIDDVEDVADEEVLEELDDVEDINEEDVIEDVDDIEEEELIDDVEDVADEEVLEELDDVEDINEEDVIEDVNDVEEEEVIDDVEDVTDEEVLEELDDIEVDDGLDGIDDIEAEAVETVVDVDMEDEIDEADDIEPDDIWVDEDIELEDVLEDDEEEMIEEVDELGSGGGGHGKDKDSGGSVDGYLAEKEADHQVEMGLPVDSLGQEYADEMSGKIKKARLLAEEFDGLLGAMDRHYNQYINIPDGKYVVGSSNPKKDERAEQFVKLSAFYIGRFPVTNGLFEIFVEKTGYKTTAEKVGYGNVYSGRIQKKTDEKTGIITSTWNASIACKIVEGACWYQPSGPGSTLHNKRTHPVVQISLEDAMAFAAWTGKRLPTEDEWEAASRTEKGLIFPWGNSWQRNSCNNEENGLGDTTPVDQYVTFENDFGVADMLGNVLEWIWDGSEYVVDKPNHIKYYIGKGGSWISGDDIRLFSRFRLDPESHSNILGFRCVAD